MFDWFIWIVIRGAWLAEFHRFLKHCLFGSLMKRWAKGPPSITYGQSVWLLSSTFINKFLIVLFYLSTRLFTFGWHALVKCLMMPVRRCNLAETLLTNSRPWSLICMEKQPCLHVSSCKNCETVVAFLSLSRFASENLLQ